MTGLFRPLKRRTGMLVGAVAVAGGVAVLLSLFAGDTLLLAGGGLLVVGYAVAVLVGVFTARNPQSVAYLVVAAGGVLVVLSALAGARATFFVAALLLGVAGWLLYRAGQLPEDADRPGDEPDGDGRPGDEPKGGEPPTDGSQSPGEETPE